MTLIDSLDVRWPDAVLPGSKSAQILLAARKAKELSDRQQVDQLEAEQIAYDQQQ